MKAVAYLLILLLLSGQPSALEAVVPLPDSQTDADADDADSGEYLPAEQKSDWLRASQHRKSVPASFRFATDKSFSSLRTTALSAGAQGTGPFRPPPLYVLMSLQR